MPSNEPSVDVSTLLASWNEMSEHFLAGRGQLLDTATDWIEQRTPRSIIELGSGPGTTLRSLRTRMTDVDLTGVDCDPVLRRLHEAAITPQERIRLINADLSQSSWTSAVTTVTDPDVVIAVQVLHYFGPERFDGLLREVRQLIGLGGTLVHLDHVPSPDNHYPCEPDSASTEESVGTGDPWSSWWTTAATIGLLADAFSERAELVDTGPGSYEYHPDQDRLLQHLSDAGFHDFKHQRSGNSLLTIATAR